MRAKRWRARGLSAVVVTSLLTVGWPALTAAAASGPDAASGPQARASSAQTKNAAGGVTDGDQSTYWQSSGGELPQWVQTDLGSTVRTDGVVLKLPAGWASRTQTLAVQGSADGTSFTTLKTSATYTFSPGRANAVTVNYPATRARYVRIAVTDNSVADAAQLSELEVKLAGESSVNLASGRTLTESSHTDVYPASNANDGNRSTYWESANNAFPQWIQADLGSAVQVNRVVLRLPDSWGPRSQTLKIQGSANGTAFTDLTASRAYAFDAAGGQSAALSFDATTTRYVRALFTANSVQPGAQLSEFEVYGPDTGDTQAPSAPRPRPHRARERSDQAVLERLDRQHGGHRLRRLRQQRPADQRRGRGDHLHRQPARQPDRVVLRTGQGRGREPVGQQQHRHPAGRHRGHHGADGPLRAGAQRAA